MTISFLVQNPLALWQHGKDECRCAGAVFDEHGGHIKHSACGRKFVQIRDILQGQFVCGKANLMDDEIFGFSRIDAGGVQADAFDVSLFYEESGRFF